MRHQNGKKRSRAIRIERCKILSTSASHKMRYAKRKKEEAERERENKSEPTHEKNREERKRRHTGGKGAFSRKARNIRAKQGATRPRKRQTDGFTYLQTTEYEFAVLAFRKTSVVISRSSSREERARAWKLDGNRATQGRIPFPMLRALVSEQANNQTPHSFLPFFLLFLSLLHPWRFSLADCAVHRRDRKGQKEEKSEGEQRAPSRRSIHLIYRINSTHPFFGNGAYCELQNGGGVFVARGSRVHSTGQWTAQRTRVSLRKSRKKASDVPATVRRTADIAAPSRAVLSTTRNLRMRATRGHTGRAASQARDSNCRGAFTLPFVLL